MQRPILGLWLSLVAEPRRLERALPPVLVCLIGYTPAIELESHFSAVGALLAAPTGELNWRG